MSKKFKIAGAFLALVWMSIAVNAQSVVPGKSWEDVKKQAVKEQKIIFVDLYFTGCAPCAQMDREVFPNPKVAKVLSDDYIVFKSDILKEEIGKELSMKYAVTGFPTFLMINANGQLIDNASGFHAVDQFLDLLETGKDKAKKGLFKKYSTQISKSDYPEFYLKAYLENKRNVPYEMIDSYLKAQPTLYSEVPFVIISGLRVGGKYEDFYLENAQRLATDFASNSVTNYLYTILQRKKKVYEKANDLEGFKKLLSTVTPVFTPEEYAKYESILLKDFGVVKVNK